MQSETCLPRGELVMSAAPAPFWSGTLAAARGPCASVAAQTRTPRSARPAGQPPRRDLPAASTAGGGTSKTFSAASRGDGARSPGHVRSGSRPAPLPRRAAAKAGARGDAAPGARGSRGPGAGSAQPTVPPGRGTSAGSSGPSRRSPPRLSQSCPSLGRAGPLQSRARLRCVWRCPSPLTPSRRPRLSRAAAPGPAVPPRTAAAAGRGPATPAPGPPATVTVRHRRRAPGRRCHPAAARRGPAPPGGPSAPPPPAGHVGPGLLGSSAAAPPGTRCRRRAALPAAPLCPAGPAGRERGCPRARPDKVLRTAPRGAVTVRCLCTSPTRGAGTRVLCETPTSGTCLLRLFFSLFF